MKALSHLNDSYTKCVGNTEPGQRSEGEILIYLSYNYLCIFPMGNSNLKWTTKPRFLSGNGIFKKICLVMVQGPGPPVLNP